jgi:hypothetical protein
MRAAASLHLGLLVLAACGGQPEQRPESAAVARPAVEPALEPAGAAEDAVHAVPAATAADAFVFSDAGAFAVEVVDGDVVLTAKGGARYAPPHRSPLNIALLDTFAFGDFVLEVEVQQTGREYGHRDLCLFFGHQAPDRFHYVHIASKADPNAHNVFVVDGAPRRNIATRTTEGVEWGSPDSWHRVRLARRGGTVRVFFDDMDSPILEAEDARLGVGRIGFGSFDDEGRFRRIRITGDPRPLPEAPPFAR